MTQANHNIGAGTLGVIARAGLLAALFAAAVPVAAAPPSVKRTVTLNFADSAMVNDTLIRIGDIARVSSSDAALAALVREFSAGEAAPAGFSRYINTADLLVYRVQPRFKDVEFIGGSPKRVKVASDHQDRTVGEFEAHIRAFAEERLGWAKGEWELAVNNPQSSWKSGRGDVDVTVTGLDNPFTKGNTSLTLVVRQGSRVNRIPALCKITVKASVLTASRQIQRGEELTGENSVLAVMDITSFAYAPLTKLPEAGTMTVSRSVTAGGILHGKMLAPIPLVARGDQVRIHYIGERVRISVLGVARDSGRGGDRIWVENLQTGKLIRAAVSGRGSVVVHQEGDRS